MSFLEVKNLSKSYGKTEVFKDLSFNLERGKLLGLLGPNGCGKSTLLKILAGLLKDYQGSVIIDGSKPGPHLNKRIVYQPDFVCYPKWQTAKKLIAEHSKFFDNFKAEKANALLAQIGIDKNQKLQNMSKGMQEKLQIILAISREAELYLLDEPIAGVDPASRELILKIILDHLSEESLLIISTHLISEIEHVFDELIFLKDGNLLCQASADELRLSEGMSINEYFIKVFAHQDNEQIRYIGQS
ncbi:MAG: ABC transporter ATP-binding protein [Eubacteriales bacterium]|nr:ABC transporter ATP-binding protein [Eubacteriales bacterium]